MARYSARLAQLETKHTKQNEIHLIMCGNDHTDNESFDLYRAGRVLAGYKPTKPWEYLKAAFLSQNDENLTFIKVIEDLT